MIEILDFLNETFDKLEEYGVTPDDIEWVGCRYFRITWDNFVEIARGLIYDKGYGSAEIAEDLVIVGKNWWLSREEYDGAEWWKFNKMPNKPVEIKKINALTNKQAIDYAMKNCLDHSKLHDLPGCDLLTLTNNLYNIKVNIT